VAVDKARDNGDGSSGAIAAGSSSRRD